MMQMPETIWWQWVTGPGRYARAIGEALCGPQQKSVLLRAGDALPWRWQLREAVEESLRGEGIAVEYIAGDGLPGGDAAPGDIGIRLLERFAPQALAAYRPHRGESAEAFLRRESALSGRVLWLYGLQPQQAVQWEAFIRRYKSTGIAHGLFVLEVDTAHPRNAAQGGCVAEYATSDWITPYDLQLFASIVVAQSGIPGCLQQYAIFTAAALCGMDPDAVVSLIAGTNFERDNPAERYRACCAPASAPPPGALEHRLWKAQVQVAYPIIEAERVAYTQKYRESIEACLPLTQYNVEITEPVDVELGTLCYLMGEDQGDHLKRLYIPDPDDFDRIVFLRRLRNNLAHRIVCDPEDMWLLLSQVRDDGY